MHSNAEECDSPNTYRAQRLQETKRNFTFNGAVFQKACFCTFAGDALQNYNSKLKNSICQAEHIAVHSQLLKESHLVHFPPLTYMLKFSRFTCFTSCCSSINSKGYGRSQRCLIGNSKNNTHNGKPLTTNSFVLDERINTNALFSQAEASSSKTSITLDQAHLQAYPKGTKGVPT